jgi:hypothetical protein
MFYSQKFTKKFWPSQEQELHILADHKLGISNAHARWRVELYCEVICTFQENFDDIVHDNLVKNI